MEELLELVEEQTDGDGDGPKLELETEVPAVPGGGPEAGDGAGDGPSFGEEDGLLEESGRPSLPRGGDNRAEGASGPPEGAARSLWREEGADGPERREADGRTAGEAPALTWMARRPDGAAGPRAAAWEAEGVRAAEKETGQSPPEPAGGERQSEAPVWRKAGDEPRALKWPEGEFKAIPPEGPGEGARRGTERELPSSAPRGPEDGRLGLEELYRRTAQAARPVLQAAGGPEGRTVRMDERDAPRQLTVDELDRAVRRDSRRYDGGMSIF